MHSLMAAMLFGIDSLVVSAALSPMFKLWSPGWRLAFAFGACDAIAFLVGSAFSLGPWARDVAEPALPAAVLAYGFYALAAVRWSGFRAAARPAYLLPVLMSLDNLAGGVLAGSPIGGTFEQAAVLGLTSGGLSLLGLAAGNVLFSRLARQEVGSAASALIAASFLLLVAR
jgi:hypothetical protein